MEQNTVATLAMLSGWIFGLYGYLRSSKSDSAEDAKTIGSILTNLKSIDSKLTDLKARIDLSDRDNREVLERIAVLEQSEKSAHHRIDMLEKHNE